MATLTSSLIVKLIDGISAPARGAAASLRGLTRAGAGSFSERLAGGQAKLAAATERNNTALANQRGKLFEAVAGFYALKAALGAPLDAARDFETMLEDIGQKADIPVAHLKALGDSIRKVARDTNQSTKDIGGAVDFLIGMGASEDVALAVSAPIGRAAAAYRASTEDLGRATFAAVDNLKVPAGDAAFALDAMAKAGKEGGFELKDMAKEFPGLTASAQFLGMRGTTAVADLAAALEVARKGASDGATAANNMANFLQKINSPQTLKNFAKMGVSVPEELAKAAKEGVSPIEHMLDVIQRLTNGDSTKIGKLFQDKQVLEAIKPLLANMDEYRRIRDEALKSQGTVETDFARRIETAEGVQQRFGAAVQNLSISIGQALIPALNKLLDTIIPVMDRVGEWVDLHPQLTAAILGSVGALVSLRIATTALTFAGLLGKAGALSALAAGFDLVKVAGTPIAGLFETIALRSRLAAASTGAGPGFFASMADGLIVLTRALGAPALMEGLAALAPILGPIAIAAAAIALGGKFIHDNWSGLGAMWNGFVEGLKPLMPALDALRAAVAPLQPVFDAVGAAINSMLAPLGPLVSAITSLSFTIPATDAQWKAWGETVGGGVAAGVNTLIGGIQQLISFLTQAWAAVTGLGTAISNLWNSGGTTPSPAGPSAVINGTPDPGLPMPNPDSPPSGHRARGGKVWPGGSFLVGEHEPEVFTPSGSGRITPLGAMGGGGSIHIGPFTFHGISGDPAELERSMRRVMEDAINSLLRGAHSDTGARA